MNVIAVIPARYASVRFPAKMLADRTGKPLVQHVYERAVQAKMVSRVVIATDDDRIANVVRSFGGEVVMTSADHPNGTSRIAEAAESLDADILINVQGDEPEMDPALIDLAVQKIIDDGEVPMSTVASPMNHEDDPANPNIVKVVLDQRSRAMYFSRSLIPHDRDGDGVTQPLKHVGLYVYRRSFLPSYLAMSATPMETSERLEQLRVLEHGEAIAVAIAPSSSQGIDTPEQYDAFVKRYQAAQGK